MKTAFASFGLVLAGLGTLAVQIASAEAILHTAFTFLLFSLPGVLVGMALFGRPTRKQPESLFLGAVVGLALSGYVSIAVGYLAYWSVKLIVYALLLLTLATAAVTRRRWRQPLITGLREWNAPDFTLLALMFLVLIGFQLIPFANVGALTPHGYAYTWLFGYDFLIRVGHLTSMTHGLPPEFLHLSGMPLRLYLLSYALPAFAYSSADKMVAAESVLLLCSVGYSLLLVACLYAFLRHFLSNLRPLAWTAAAAMAGYSYYWIYVLVRRPPLNSLVSLVPSLDTAKLLQFGDVSHLLQRSFLVEPQAVLGLCVFVVVLLVLELVKHRIASYAIAAILGTLLGTEFAIEAVNGLLLVGWFGVVQAARLLWQRIDFKRELGPLSVVAGICILFYLSFFALGVYDFGTGRMISIKPYWGALLLSPFYFLIEFGPLIVLGLWGLRLRWQRNPSTVSIPLMGLFSLTLLQMLLLTSPHAKTLGILRGSRLLPLVLLVWTGYLFYELYCRASSRRARLVASVLVCAALPTFFTDIYFTSNIKEPLNTRYVRVADREACEWIRGNTPEDAIFQGEPEYLVPMNVPTDRQRALSLIGTFAERQQVLGSSDSTYTVVGAEQIAQSRSTDLQRMFNGRSISEVNAVVDKYGIDYLYVGPYEQQLYPTFFSLLNGAPDLYREVYRTNAVHIFKREFELSPR